MSDITTIIPMHNFKLDHRREFDEIFIDNASVHIERMDSTAFWIGIRCAGKPDLMVNTGVYRGQWYFNIEEDSMTGKRFEVQRPRYPKLKKSMRKK